ncbi:hypothetical protein L1987_58123 [Smallanthus sonchifolius]|uniref:Uncharacterized protein n=1 Tax=Smallanthus sonchifolius TaxID=185202 RepID=A0ACB9DF78_9ASTR|nr:hypothetical protein L1987_58123 [Smallanthus sonchifolius]
MWRQVTKEADMIENEEERVSGSCERAVDKKEDSEKERRKRVDFRALEARVEDKRHQDRIPSGIEDHRFPIRLFVMILGGFDVILGMDWLTANEAQTICKRKIIRLKAPDGSDVEVFGDHDISMPNVISMIKAKDYLRRRCEAYLVYVINNYKVVKELDGVPVVHEYPEVFPEDFPGVPPG